MRSNLIRVAAILAIALFSAQGGAGCHEGHATDRFPAFAND